MTRTEFVEELRQMADDIESGSFHFIHLGDNGKYIFANRNYGEVYIGLGEVINISVRLFDATEEEKKQFEKE